MSCRNRSIQDQDHAYKEEIQLLLRQTDRLCKLCQNVFDKWNRVLEQLKADELNKTITRMIFHHHGSPEALETAAEEGCGLCGQFVSSNEKEPREPTKTGFQSDVTYVQFDESDINGTPDKGQLGMLFLWFDWQILPGLGGLTLKIPYFNGELDASKQFKEDDAEPLYYTYCAGMFETTQQALQYDSSEPGPNTMDALPLCKRWLQACCTSHKTCISKQTGIIPNRLIYIGNGSTRLCLANEIPAGTSFVTLSHCWGSLQFSHLTRENIESFKRTIPPEALPKTFQHAIYISRYLGYDYLWIDSLCIIQNDSADWAQESASMVNIYGSSALNLIASSAKDATVGCFFPRKKTWRCQIRESSTGQQKLYNCFLGHFPAKETYEFTYRRAWILQERFMSTRILHLTQERVFWTCSELVACEFYPYGHPPITDYINRHLEFKAFTPQRSSWSTIVEQYSSCGLTKSSDKLVALGGLAQIVQDQTKDQYIAGMWGRNLERQLCWSVKEGEPGEFLLCQKRPSPYRAPSWSWASVDDQIRYEEDRTAQLFIEVLDVRINYANSNIFGEITSAALRLRCDFLYPVGLVFKRDHISDRNGNRTRDYDSIEEVLLKGHKPYDQLMIQIAPDCREIYTGNQTISPTYHLLPIHQEETMYWKYWDPTWTGLMLRSTGIKNGQYYRIGYYRSLPWPDHGAPECFVCPLTLSEFQAEGSDFLEQRITENKSLVRIIEII